MFMRIGPNDHCACGRGKKHKKYCVARDRGAPISELPPEVIKKLAERERRRQMEILSLRSIGIYINYVNPIIFKSKKVWVLGGRIFVDHDPDETFHEFIIWVLQHTLGKPWLDEQGERPVREQHFIYRCFLAFTDWRLKNSVPENKQVDGTWAHQPDGWTKSLMALAFDVASLQHANNMPEDLLKRLKTRDGYQGARYEIAVAAIFARLGFDISFIKPVRGPKHCEFIAKHQESKIEIAVEAKSRHRMGVLHTPGATDDRKLARGDVGKLLNEAFKKTEFGKMPFIAFIDVNCPMSGTDKFFDDKWGRDIQRLMGGRTPTAADPDLHSALCFTNFSYHYQAGSDASNSECLTVIPMFSAYPIKDPSFFSGLGAALKNHGHVPLIELKDDQPL